MMNEKELWIRFMVGGALVLAGGCLCNWASKFAFTSWLIYRGLTFLSIIALFLGLTQLLVGIVGLDRTWRKQDGDV
jgi:hypothetical protein